MKENNILKFDIKDKLLRCDLYKVDNIRITGRVQTTIINLTKGNIFHILNVLFIKLNDTFKLNIKKNNLSNINSWLKQNIIKIHIRKNVPEEIKNKLLKRFNSNVILIND